jgi:hypothetical protein
MAALSGCASTGLKEAQGISETFTVGTEYQAATRRAGQYMRVCHIERLHHYGVEYGSGGEKGVRDAPNKLWVFRTTEPSKLLEIIETRMAGPDSATVTVRVLGQDPWDAAELAAAKQSIQSATPACRPFDSLPPPDRVKMINPPL